MSYNAFASVYDRLTQNVDYKRIASFIKDIIIKEKPDASLVLDMACGTGSLAIELDRLGFDVTAADASVDMLNAARERSPHNILYLCQKMEKLDMFGTMGAIVCTLDSINHITSKEKLKEVFRRAALFLDNDGVLIFDANTTYKHKYVLADNVFIYDLDEIYCVWQNATDESLLTRIELDFFVRDENGTYTRSGESFCERAYSDSELEAVLNENGFIIKHRYDDYTYNAPGDGTQRVVYVCKKDCSNQKGK